ncbi:MAG: c-type cytochrome domain-containing protein [Verrucomicrobiota bacterium]
MKRVSRKMLIALASAIGFSFGPSAFAAVDFGKEIWPIIKTSCLNCHKAEYIDQNGRKKKPKGGLRVDDMKLLMEGGDGGEVIIPGEPDKSTFYTFTILPEDDPDVMPAKGDLLTKEQTDKIKAWIQEGANFNGFTPSTEDLAASAAPKRKLSPVEMLAKDVKPLDAAQLDALKKTGALVMPLAQNNPLIRVDFSYADGEVGDETLKLLDSVKTHLTELHLGGTKVSDAGLAKISGMSKLTRLHLEKTGIGDAGLKSLGNLNNLEYLNLYSSKVTDAGMDALTGLKGLRKLYLWQTGVTDVGATKLKKANPQIYVSRGWEHEPKAEAKDAGGDAEKKEPEKKEPEKKEPEKKEPEKKK